MIEVEVKIPIENIEKIKQKLLETGFIYQKTVVETEKQLQRICRLVRTMW